MPLPALNYRRLVFLTALCTLMFELLLARLADFHLGSENAYLALPIAFLGLAAGSLHMHLLPKALDRFRPVRDSAILAGLCVAGLLFGFVFFSWYMPVTSAQDHANQLWYLAAKTGVFVVGTTPPFYAFGRILTSVYHHRKEDIGRIYSADFLGAALACFIVPVAFHYGGLPTVVVSTVLVCFLPLISAVSGKRRVAAAAVAVVAGLACQTVITRVDATISYDNYRSGAKFSEHDRGWNEHSRVAVVEKTREDGKSTFHIIHNNSRSNVKVWQYRADKKIKPRYFEGKEAAWVLGRKPANILVMFAGTGAEMIRFNELARGEAQITGVELNPLVREFGENSEALAHFRVRDFLALPHIDLVIDEGRHFLATRPDDTRYDLIYVGSNAATPGLTGHSRKYLDTVEAYERYLDLLADDGLIVFDHQPLERRITTMRAAFERKGIPDFEDRVIVMDSRSSNDDMVIAKSGFRPSELDAVKAFVAPAKSGKRRGKRRGKLRYFPGGRGPKRAKYERLVLGDAADGPPMTDDRPFLRDLGLAEYDLVPDEDRLKKVTAYISWVKVTTVIVLSTIALVFMLLASAKRESRAPPSVLAYLVLTGFAFMLCEVALMAKLELFLSQPLLSMAAVLSLFLLTSGIGSAIYPRVAHLADTRRLAPAVAILVLLTMTFLGYAGANWLALPIVVKLLIAAIAIAPLGLALGLFYPHIVSCLVDGKRDGTVAISYGLSTLASVVGSSFAMTAMIETGFDALLLQAVALYVGLTVLAWVYAAAGGRWLRRSVG